MNRIPPDQLYLQGAELHKPDAGALATEVLRWSATGLTDRDIAACMRLDLGEVRDILLGWPAPCRSSGDLP